MTWTVLAICGTDYLVEFGEVVIDIVDISFLVAGVCFCLGVPDLVLGVARVVDNHVDDIGYHGVRLDFVTQPVQFLSVALKEWSLVRWVDHVFVLDCLSLLVKIVVPKVVLEVLSLLVFDLLELDDVVLVEGEVTGVNMLHHLRVRVVEVLELALIHLSIFSGFLYVIFKALEVWLVQDQQGEDSGSMGVFKTNRDSVPHVGACVVQVRNRCFSQRR